MTPGTAGHRHEHDGHPLHIQPANADASEALAAAARAGLYFAADASEALAAAARAGPYFAIEPWAEGAGWRPASLLVCDPAVLSERVGAPESSRSQTPRSRAVFWYAAAAACTTGCRARGPAVTAC